LPAGKYTLHVKAQNQYGKESNEITIVLEIAVSWYASRWAYFCYLMSILGLLYLFQKRQKRKFEHEKSSLQQKHLEKESEHLLKAYQSQESINRLQEENLEAEIRHKNQELVSATLHITQKNEMLNTVRIALDKIKSKSLGPAEMQQEIEQVVRMVQNDANLDADWESFVHNFDTIHNDFFKRLKEQFPSLRTNDFKLCAYLRLNLTSKDVSKLMNISTRSVETNRYRLRKKLELSNDTNLTEFLINY
jgi:DNA-binding CsgD family transcriptional regulator